MSNALEQRTEILLSGAETVIVPLGITAMEQAISETIAKGMPFVKVPLIAGAITINVGAIAALRPALTERIKDAQH